MFESMLLIFTACAVLGAIATIGRQPLIMVYIVLGCALGPYGLQWVTDDKTLSDLGHIGIIFLLFIVGLELPPQKIRNVLRQSIVTVLVSTATFFLVGMGIGKLFGFSTLEAVIAGIAVVFSSTVVGIKFLPKTVLHHRHIGEIVIGLLLLQDLLAIIAPSLHEGLRGRLRMASVGYGRSGNSSADCRSLRHCTLGLLAADANVRRDHGIHIRAVCWLVHGDFMDRSPARGSRRSRRIHCGSHARQFSGFTRHRTASGAIARLLSGPLLLLYRSKRRPETTDDGALASPAVWWNSGCHQAGGLSLSHWLAGGVQGDRLGDRLQNGTVQRVFLVGVVLRSFADAKLEHADRAWGYGSHDPGLVLHSCIQLQESARNLGQATS